MPRLQSAGAMIRRPTFAVSHPAAIVEQPCGRPRAAERPPGRGRRPAHRLRAMATDPAPASIHPGINGSRARRPQSTTSQTGRRDRGCPWLDRPRRQTVASDEQTIEDQHPDSTRVRPRSGVPRTGRRPSGRSPRSAAGARRRPRSAARPAETRSFPAPVPRRPGARRAW